MFQQSTPVFKSRERVYQISFMLPVKHYLLVDFPLVFFYFFIAIKVIASVFSNAKMLYVSNLVPLRDCKIGSIWLMGTKNIVRIDFFV